MAKRQLGVAGAGVAEATVIVVVVVMVMAVAGVVREGGGGEECAGVAPGTRLIPGGSAARRQRKVGRVLRFHYRGQSHCGCWLRRFGAGARRLVSRW